MKELLETLRLVQDQRWMISYFVKEEPYRIGDISLAKAMLFRIGSLGSISHLQENNPAMVTIDIASIIPIDTLGLPIIRNDLYLYYKRIKWN